MTRFNATMVQQTDGTRHAYGTTRMKSTRRQTATNRGFTLVELLAVVTMVGILATLAIVGYQKYMASAGSAEAAAVIQGIRGAEESYKSEMLVYLGCSGCASPTGCPPGAGSLTSYYPMNMPNKQKYAWPQPAHADYACWRLLNITTDGPVRFGYAVVAGLPGPITAVTSVAKPPVWPVVNEPWYVIQASGDRDGDGIRAMFLASSLQGQVYFENDTE